ncbi:MAG: hypothetical protein ACP5MZ_02645 [Candidatus Micrarchaeia archaeon]
MALEAKHVYYQAAARKNDMDSGKHELLNSLLLPFIGYKIRDNERRLKKTRNMLEKENTK